MRVFVPWAVMLTWAALVIASYMLIGYIRDHRRKRAIQAAEWEIYVQHKKTKTIVGVHRVLRTKTEEMVLDRGPVIAEISADDPDWLLQVQLAETAAADRLYVLNRDR